MKKIASLIIAAVAVVACSSPSVFIVKGERADLQGTVSMVSAGDTLAKAEIVNGAFTLKVPAEVQTVGRICINGKKIADGVMVEPGNAVVEFAESGKAYVTGTASNDIMANYFKTDDELYLQYKKAQTDEERMAIRTKMGENTL
ncbi:MAG: DUF4369 domain-containing protein, partial [Bacteroidales bacterium]|nr:DUF4369 domain-containing protein [Bacteroidales bacterium]